MKKLRWPISRGRMILLILVAQGVFSMVYRFAFGLGSCTALTDRFPWGLWIAFDVMAGVALAAGGFVLAGTYYIFNLKQFRPLVKPAVLTAFLGYLMVVFGLLCDLGRPLVIWHPLVFWQEHSAMFELSICVSMYTTVLFLEFSPILLEGLGKRAWAEKMHRAIIPLAILGIVLSTMHQSSLGTLFVLMPYWLHHLWYTPLLPWFFLLTALAVGPAMVTVESYLCARSLRRPFELTLLGRLSRFTRWVLALYLGVRCFDLWQRGSLALALVPSLESVAFYLELTAGVIVPLFLFFWPTTKQNTGQLVTANALVVLGVILNRANVAVTGLIRTKGDIYVPSLSEFSVTIGLVALAI
ncbi:MAG: Ni/Fe-hydrogenase cytochrome b subunit, partial [Firmicutes bacterium]|nr:Ni/Fe-hydrogenase cytochrome b subunit [Bacillota bacterium]